MSYGQKERVKCLSMLVVTLIAVFVVILAVTDFKQEQKINSLPSLMDIQERLNELEPESPIKVDGIWGQETSEKWLRVWWNQQAKRHFGKQNEKIQNKTKNS
jgi:hypothetical protein